MTRRDKCHLAAKRATRLKLRQAALAWYALAFALEELGKVDSAYMPKFRDLYRSIRLATIIAQKPPEP